MTFCVSRYVIVVVPTKVNPFGAGALAASVDKHLTSTQLLRGLVDLSLLVHRLHQQGLAHQPGLWRQLHLLGLVRPLGQWHQFHLLDLVRRLGQWCRLHLLDLVAQLGLDHLVGLSTSGPPCGPLGLTSGPAGPCDPAGQEGRGKY